MSRMAVYVFWEKDGIVRDYVTTYLKGLMDVAEKIYVVVNGEIREDSRGILQDVGATVLVRPNEGVDFWAYKAALDYEGATISAYDEVILCNCSCYGPVYPFAEMFEEMAKRSVDFWGITEWPLNGGGYHGTWILSYFLVFRPHLFLSAEWARYWKNLSQVESREECIDKHETKFTRYFAEKGFTYDVYCKNSAGYMDITIEAPDKLVIEQRCPLIKRKAFCTEVARFLPYHRGKASRRVFDYVHEHDLYDTDIILDDLLATQHYANLKDCLQLNWILSSRHTQMPLKREPRVAVCFHMTYVDMLDSCFEYLRSVPSYADVYLTVSDIKLVEIIREKTISYRIAHARIVLISGKSGGWDAFWAIADDLLKHDYVCIAHDERHSSSAIGLIPEEFSWHNLDALLASPIYVENILSVFEQNPRLGILAPVSPVYGCIGQSVYGEEWGTYYLGTKEFLNGASVDVPINPDVPPIAPWGGMFWFRSICLKRLLEIDIMSENFMKNRADGSLYPILERSYPFFAQAAGYLTGWVSAVEDAQVHLTNFAYLYRQANRAICGIPSTVYVTTEVNIGVRRSVKEYMKKHLHQGLYRFLGKIYHRLKS